MIKNCDGFEELCTFSASGAATDEEEKKLGAHLVFCGSCASRFNALLEVGADLVIGLSPISPPDAIRANLLEAIRQEKHITPRLQAGFPTHGKNRFPWFSAAGWGAALIFAIALLKQSGILFLSE